MQCIFHAPTNCPTQIYGWKLCIFTFTVDFSNPKHTALEMAQIGKNYWYKDAISLFNVVPLMKIFELFLRLCVGLMKV